MCISYNLTQDFATIFLKTILGMFCPLIFICLKVLLFLAALGLSCSTWNLSSWREGFFLALEHRLTSPSACGILVPWPGVELKSPVLEGGVLVAGPSGKSPPCLNLKWGQVWSCNFAFQSSFVLILPFQKRTKWWTAAVKYWSYWSDWGIVGFPDFRNSHLGFPGDSMGKESACNEGDLGLIPGLGRSPREGNGYLLQYSYLENSMDRIVWWATVHPVANSQTQLSD